MASERSDSPDQVEEAHEPRECMPCRGTGRVISNLGGTPSEVTCPWCEGGGVRLPGHDAQEHWPEATGPEAAGPEASAGHAAADAATGGDGDGGADGATRPT